MAAKKDSQTSWSCTKYKLSKVRHVWTIHSFAFCQAKTGKSLQSTIFGATDEPKWSLSLYPNGETEENREFLSLFLNISSLSKTEAFAEVEYRFTLLNDKEEIIFPKLPRFLYRKFAKGTSYGSKQFIRRGAVVKLLKNEPFNICCEVTICRGRIESSGVSNNSSGQHIFEIPKCTLVDDLTSTFNDQICGDTIIQVGGEEFLVYRGLLQARSPVFAAMFQHAMKEQKNNRIIITDIEPKVVEEMLTYIYTGRSPNLVAMADVLLPVADKYNLERLKVLSEEVLSKKIIKENVIETLILADVHTAKQLKAAAINFIATNSHYYVDASNWKNVTLLLSMYPDLFLELTTTLFSVKKKMNFYG